MRPLALVLAGLVAGCAPDSGDPSDALPESVSTESWGLSNPAARRARSQAIRDVAAGEGLTNGVLLAGIGQVETGLSHCWSEATWACKGPSSPSCNGGPVIAGSADGPCSSQQGGLGMFQFDAGTYQQTLVRDGEEILVLEGNIAHAVEFVAERVRQDVSGVDSIPAALEWLNAIPVQAGNPQFEQWIALVSCRYNGCCGCSSQEAKYRNATVDALVEFEPGFWDSAGSVACEPIGSAGAVLEENDGCAVAGGDPTFWRVEAAGHGERLMWTHTTDRDSTQNYGQWNLDPEVAGRYRLDVHIDGGVFTASQLAAYAIAHGGAQSVVTIDQSAFDGWQTLGDFDFGAGTDQWVRLNDDTGEPGATQTRLGFDALRITPVDENGDSRGPSADDPGGASEPAGWSGGCGVTGATRGGPAGFALLLGLFLLRRRRD